MFVVKTHIFIVNVTNYSPGGISDRHYCNIFLNTQATTSTRKRPLDIEAVVKEKTAAQPAAVEEATKKPKTEPDKNDDKENDGNNEDDHSSVVSKVVVDLVNTVGGGGACSSDSTNGVKAEGQQGQKGQQGDLEAARTFRERSLRRILRQNLNKAVNDDKAGVDNVVKSVEELKKKMKVVMLSALVRSKSETEEAGHDLFFSRVAAASEDEDGEESEPEPNNSSSESSKKPDNLDKKPENPEEGVVRKVLEEFIDGSKQSKELLNGDNARGNLVVDLLGSLKNELHKEVRQAKKKRRKKMAAAAAASASSAAASTSIVLTEEETKVVILWS